VVEIYCYFRGVCCFVFTMEQNTENGDRKSLRNANNFLSDCTSLRSTRKWPFIYIRHLFECLLRQLMFKFVRVAFVSVTGATVSYFGMLFLLFSDPLTLCIKLSVVRTRWFKYDRDWFVCKQAALRSSCATLREWSYNLHPPSCSG